MKTTQILIAGFGGQGILFAGKFLAYKGLLEELQVSWLPSYGPEMRGGTANCNVIVSEQPVGSPIITAPDVLIAMNLPSLLKYVDTVVPGGQIYVDSSLIGQKVERTDVEVFFGVKDTDRGQGSPFIPGNSGIVQHINAFFLRPVFDQIGFGDNIHDGAVFIPEIDLGALQTAILQIDSTDDNRAFVFHDLPGIGGQLFGGCHIVPPWDNG